MSEEREIVDQQEAEATQNKSIADKIAQLVSYILHPFVVPLYLVIVLLYANSSGLAMLPPKTKLYTLWIAVMYCMVSPMLSIGLMHSLGIVKSLKLNTRKDRIMPLVVGVVCYILSAITIAKIPELRVLIMFLIAAAACQLFGLCVTMRWQISLHLISMGGLVAIVLFVNIANIGNLLSLLSLSILASGVLATARLQLGAHNMQQVVAGFFGGFLVATATIVLILWVMTL